MRLLSSSCKKKKKKKNQNTNKKLKNKTTSKSYPRRLYSITLELRNKGESKASHRLGMEHTYINCWLQSVV